MSVQEITLLRKAGNLEEALKMAKSELESDPQNSWCQMALFWVLRDFCQKIYLPNQQKEEAVEALKKMGELLPTMQDSEGIGKKVFDNLCMRLKPEADVIMRASQISKEEPVRSYEMVRNFIKASDEIDDVWHEQLGWILFRYLKVQMSLLTSVEVRRLFSYYMNLKNDRPSLLHTQILWQALSFAHEHLDFNFYKFFLLWGPKLLSEDDFKSSLYEGREVRPFISRIFGQIIAGEYEISIDRLCQELSLPSSQIIENLREANYWYLRGLNKDNRYHEFFDALMAYSRSYGVYGPSYWHTEILKCAEFVCKDQIDDKFLYFFKVWDFMNLREEDWLEETDKAGYVHPSVAEQAAKICFNSMKLMNPRSDELLAWMSAFFDYVLEHLPQNEWLIRNRAKVYIWQNHKDEAAEYYKRLLLLMGDKYFLWAELSQSVEDDELKMGLLSKALLLERNENFLGEIHLTLAGLLIKNACWKEALCELAIYKQNRDKEGWKISKSYDELYPLIPVGTQQVQNNKSLYRRYASLAEDFVYGEIPTSCFVFLECWEKDGKKRARLANAAGQLLQVNLRLFPVLKRAKSGDMFQVRTHIIQEEKTLRVVPLTIESQQPTQPMGDFPKKYGYVSFVNQEKHRAHILIPDDGEVYVTLKNNESTRLKVGDFVSLYLSKTWQHKEVKLHAFCVEVCGAQDALPAFPTIRVIVDHVNREKEIIHYQVGSGEKDGVISFNDTEFRPQVGDLLSLTYVFKTLKDNQLRRVPLAIKAVAGGDNSNLKKSVLGELKVKYKAGSEFDVPDFAFVGHCYVPKNILVKHAIVSDCNVRAEVIYAGDEKWKVVSLEIL